MLKIAGSEQPCWNTGVKCKGFEQNGDTSYHKATEALYQEFKTSLPEDLKTSIGVYLTLPPNDHEKSDRLYSAVYWSHGGNGNECSSVFTAAVWQKLYDSSEDPADEVIVVYLNGVRSGYLDHHDEIVMFIEELIPRIGQ